jgi:hypothetical protein
MTNLKQRVRALESAAALSLGCDVCHGAWAHVVELGEGWPSWLDSSSCCRRCGQGVKLYARDLWDRLA